MIVMVLDTESNIKYLIRLSLISMTLFLLYCTAISQTKIYGGVSVPFGGFSSEDSAAGGFAKTGFALGVEYNSKSFLGSEFGVSCLLGYYPINLPALTNNRLRPPRGSQVESNAWLLIWPQVSAGYQYSISNSVSVFGKVSGGLLYGIYPEVTVIDAGVSRYTQNLSIKVAFGWGGGVGIVLNKKYSFEIRFLTSKPDYDLNTVGGSLLATEQTTIDTKTLQIMFGYIF